jgi:N-acetylglucosamine repressor
MNLGSTADLRRSNRDKVLKELSLFGPLSRTALGERVGITGASVSRITRELIDIGLVDESEALSVAGALGRRQSLLSIRPEGAFALGVTITANRKSVTLVNAVGEVVAVDVQDDLDLTEPALAIRLLADGGQRLLQQAGIDRSRLVGVGVGLAVALQPNQDLSQALSSPVLGWEDVPLAKMLSDHLRLPVKLEPRATALLRAVLRDRSIDVSGDVLLVNSGIGIGTAAKLGGRIISSGSTGLGNLAHFSVPNSKALCRCGRMGCLEAAGSGAAVLDQLFDWDQSNRPPFSALSQKLTEALSSASKGDAVARKAFNQAGEMMAYGLDAAVAIIGPNKLVLAGETGRQKDFVAGTLAGLKKLGGQSLADKLVVSAATSAQASCCVALEEFIYSHRLNISKLMAA